MIMMMAKCGNHPHPRPVTDTDVKKFYERNQVDFEKLVSNVRDGGLVTFFENLAGPGFQSFSSSGAGIRSAVVDSTGREVAGFDGDGYLTLSPAWSRYETAERRIREALARDSIEDLIASAESGVAAVEGFIAERVQSWNGSHPEDLLIDDASHKVPFNVKIEEWIPKMTGGKRIVKGSTNAQHFGQLKKFRDDFGAHIKSHAHAISSDRFVELVNRFRTGIAGMLIDLHRLFDMSVPSTLIREFYAADALKDRGVS
ncbi:hypothetical protein [Bradyrhizobium sp. CCGUVB14]|uniref:hypothetical protein n=1 Tax=Bradyrhizobium sp. CCGUVB14 TaxID=2949628 RepID=UPI0020B29D7A|nr:hypothetical protein [Bradyrhizobium sp. CCGUVB14]MCP3445813.1 hypothetical protein [Bradyrhizobium sp. CCGUVB14]